MNAILMSVECTNTQQSTYQRKKKEYNGEVPRKKHLITTALFEELKS